MADVLLSLDDEKEKMLRELARELHGGKKGSLSQAAADAIATLYAEHEHRHKKPSLQRLIETMERGYKIGLGKQKPYGKRAELYGNRFKDLA